MADLVRVCSKGRESFLNASLIPIKGSEARQSQIRAFVQDTGLLFLGWDKGDILSLRRMEKPEHATAILTFDDAVILGEVSGVFAHILGPFMADEEASCIAIQAKDGPLQLYRKS